MTYIDIQCMIIIYCYNPTSIRGGWRRILIMCISHVSLERYYPDHVFIDFSGLYDCVWLEFMTLLLVYLI